MERLPSSPPPTLTDLPEEIVLKILRLSGPKSIDACSQTCRILHTVANSVASLTAATLSKAGYGADCAELLSQRLSFLERFRRREKAWTDLTPDSPVRTFSLQHPYRLVDAAFQDGYIFLRCCKKELLGAEQGYRDTFDDRDRFLWGSLRHLGDHDNLWSSLKSIDFAGQSRKLDMAQLFLWSIDGSKDLFAGFWVDTSHTLQFQSLSTGHPHPAAFAGEVDLKLIVPFDIIRIEIVDDVLLLRSRHLQHSNELTDASDRNIVVYNWRSGVWHLPRTATPDETQRSKDAVANMFPLGERMFLRGNDFCQRLDLYTVSPSSLALLLHGSLSLPPSLFLARLSVGGHMSRGVAARSVPVPTETLAAHFVKPTARPLESAWLTVVEVEYTLNETEESEKVLIVAFTDALAQRCRNFDGLLSGSGPGEPVPWEDWALDIACVVPIGQDNVWCVYGSRILVATPWSGKWKLLDFAPHRQDSRPDLPEAPSPTPSATLSLSTSPSAPRWRTFTSPLLARPVQHSLPHTTAELETPELSDRVSIYTGWRDCLWMDHEHAVLCVGDGFGSPVSCLVVLDFSGEGRSIEED